MILVLAKTLCEDKDHSPILTIGGCKNWFLFSAMVEVKTMNSVDITLTVTKEKQSLSLIPTDQIAIVK